MSVRKWPNVDGSRDVTFCPPPWPSLSTQLSHPAGTFGCMEGWGGTQNVTSRDPSTLGQFWTDIHKMNFLNLLLSVLSIALVFLFLLLLLLFCCCYFSEINFRVSGSSTNDMVYKGGRSTFKLRTDRFQSYSRFCFDLNKIGCNSKTGPSEA